MHRTYDEQLSALVDGELEQHEHELLLRRLETDRELRARWGRYHLISDVLRNHVPERIAPGLSQRIAAQLEMEAVHSERVSSKGVRTRLGKQAAGAALAAAIAVVAVVAVQPGGDGVSEDVVRTAAVEAGAKPESVQSERPQPAALSQAERRIRLNGYLVNHNEYSTAGGMQGMLPYTRIMSSPAQE